MQIINRCHHCLFIVTWLIVSAALIGVARADVKFTSPKAGSSTAAGSTLTVEWDDTGDAPALVDLTTYQLFLCAGGNDPDNFIQLMDITTQGNHKNGKMAQGTIPPGIGASKPGNAYFLKMISVVSTGGTVINYSQRFTITDMTGSFPPNVLSGALAITGVDGPKTEKHTTDAPNNSPSNIDMYQMPFAMQTGPTRYAPMQPLPGTRISKSLMTPLYPTSSAPVATTFLPPATVQTTMTEHATYAQTFMENTADPVPGPQDDMAKFLARWKD